MPYNTPACAEQPLLNWVDRHRRWLWAAIALLLLAGFNGQYRIGSDSAMYLCTGRAISQGLGYTYNGQTNTLAFPGLPLLIGACYSGSMQWGLALTHIIMPFFGLAYLVLIYRLFLLHAGRPVAMLITCLVAISYNTYSQFYEVLTDVPFSMGVMAVLLGYEILVRTRAPEAGDGRTMPVTDTQNNPDALGSVTERPIQGVIISSAPSLWPAWLMLVAGLIIATLMRPTVLALHLAILLTAAWQFIRGQARTRHVAIGCLAIGVLVLFYLFDLRRLPDGCLGNRAYEVGLVSRFASVGSMLTRAITEFVPNLFEGIAAESLIGIELGPGIDSLFTVVLLGTGLLLFFRNPLWAALIATNIAMMMVLNSHPRYFIPILPLLIYGLWRGAVGLASRLPQHYQGWPILIAFVLLVVPNVVKTGRFIFRQHQQPFYEHYQGGLYAPLIELGQALGRLVDKDAMVLAQYGRELSFLSNRYVHIASELARHKTDSEICQRLMSESEIFVVQPTDVRFEQWIESMPLPLGPPIFSIATEPSGPNWTIRPVLGPLHLNPLE